MAGPLDSQPNNALGFSVTVTPATPVGRVFDVCRINLPKPTDVQLTLTTTDPAGAPPVGGLVPPLVQSPVNGYFYVTWGSGDVGASQFAWVDATHGITIPLHASTVTVRFYLAAAIGGGRTGLVSAAFGPGSTQNSGATFTTQPVTIAASSAQDYWVPPFASSVALFADGAAANTFVKFYGPGGIQLGSKQIPSLLGVDTTLALPGNCSRVEVTNGDGAFGHIFTLSFSLAF